MTRNKMPRWISEGISVYEERQAHPAWGQKMNPNYREMILGGELTPVGDLSSAFLTPKSSLHVQFAYYESSLVVEYIIQNFGFDALKKILRDLGDGVTINEAIARNTAPMEKIEKDFAAFARDRANNLGPGLDWTKPVDPNVPPEFSNLDTNVVDYLQQLIHHRQDTNAPAINNSSANIAHAPHNPALPNYWDLTHQADTALKEKRWSDAKVPLQKLIELCPNQTGPDSPCVLMAAACRGMADPNQERMLLQKFTSLDSDDTEAYLRLMELDQSAGDWPGVSENAARFLAVNPLVPQPYRYLARASDELGHTDPAIRSYERLLLLDPPDPADVHYHLARLLHGKNDAAAKRQVLQSLEEAPRFRDALTLLLEIEKNNPASPAPAAQLEK